VSELSLRPATAADVPRLTELAKAGYGRYVERMGRPPRPMTDDYSQVIREFEVAIAERGGEVVGFVATGPADEGFVLENVCVDPSVEDTGVGRTLLEHAEAEARRAGFDSIYLYTHELMTENQELYARIGYAEYERRPVDFGGRIVLMRKPLD
jgi:N-acetylglutamate synthase-like GNAT family acetyltransferase